jgi:hypothetical protein
MKDISRNLESSGSRRRMRISKLRRSIPECLRNKNKIGCWRYRREKNELRSS